LPSTSPTSLSVPLLGAGGEPVSFPFTVHSHGLAALPPGRIEENAYETCVRLGTRLHRLRFTERAGALSIKSDGKLNASEARAVRAIAVRMFRLEDNLAPFYATIEGDAALAWARAGAGRLLASPLVFDDIVRTICTTNCTWSATTRMITALVDLGGGAFPTAEQLARTPLRWFSEKAKMGYRGAYVRAIAADVAAGLNVEILLPRHGLDEEEVEERLLALPGVGPYAAAHLMQLLGYHRRLILDSWTRPTFLKLSGMKRASDTTIRRRFARYGAYAGLAFWLYLTKRWHE
jgi:3-methyladenine DNA glycosylase/8-oxoguanine DNA glycosylase